MQRISSQQKYINKEMEGIKTKYNIHQKVFFMYEGKVKSDGIVSMNIYVGSENMWRTTYTIFIYFGVFKDSIELSEDKIFKTEDELLNSLKLGL